ncbi:hypothetical protein D043_3707B, partial [Vibrio parahaemolyticus EKP-021]
VLNNKCFTIIGD